MADHFVTLFVKSAFTQVVQDGEWAIVWHSLFGVPKVVSSSLLDTIELFAVPRSLESFYDEYEVDDAIQVMLKELISDYYLIPEGFDERAFLAERMCQYEQAITDGSLINYLELIMSEACNFRCTYCIHFNNLETSSRLDTGKRTMRFEVAKQAVDRYLAILRQHGKTVAEINFGGGEPLLAWPVMVQVLKYCRSQYSQEFTFKFSINTNASLITPDIACALKEYQVWIASSLDGIGEGNDKVHLTQSGHGTFNAIMKGYNILAEVGYPLDGISVTINEHNFSYLTEEIIDWAATRGMKEVRIDVDVIDMVDIPLLETIDRLLRIRRYAQSHDIYVGGFWSRAIANIYHHTLEEHVAFCGAVRGSSMCVSPPGKIYGCGYSTTQLGTIDDIGNFHIEGGDYHRFVRDHLTGAMEMCKGCIIEGQCGGGCNITHEFTRAIHTDKISRMCDFYRLMTKGLLFERLQELEEDHKKGGDHRAKADAKEDADGSRSEILVRA